MKPSRIGFRFGNNQVAYSFQQLHIPLHARKKRYWLIVEVVAPATPFLLSIHAMKSLGAVIDVEKSTCYMSKLQASVPLTESKNGLLLMHLKHVCKPLEAKIAEVEILTAASTSSEPICQPPGLDYSLEPSNANQRRSDAVGSHDLRTSSRESENAHDDHDHTDVTLGSRVGSRSLSGECPTDCHLGRGDSSPISQDRRTVTVDPIWHFRNQSARRDI